MLGRYPVGIQAAHVRWHSQEGPDEIPNALALCPLHHALFDLGVVGITEDRRICVSGLYVARHEAAGPSTRSSDVARAVRLDAGWALTAVHYAHLPEILRTCKDASRSPSAARAPHQTGDAP